MNHDFPLPCLAALFDFNVEPHMIAIIIPVVAIVIGGIIAIFGMYFENRRRALWHETARVALEKGQPLPGSELDGVAKLVQATQQSSGDSGSKSDFRGGLVLIGVGAGLYLFLNEMIPPVRYVAAIPGFIGVALVLHGLLHAVFSRKKSASDDRPSPL